MSWLTMLATLWEALGSFSPYSESHFNLKQDYLILKQILTLFFLLKTYLEYNLKSLREENLLAGRLFPS